MDHRTTRQKADQAQRLGRLVSGDRDRTNLLRMAAELYERAEREDAEAARSLPKP